MNIIESTTLMSGRSYFQKIHESIMKLSPEIRFLTIIDNHGRLMFGGQREGISNYLNPQSEKESLRHAIDTWKIREKFSNAIGEGKYALAEYEKIKRITIPLDKNHIVYLTTETNIDHDRLIADILNLVQQHKIEAKN
ncbi:MAG: DUF6659 family protein [Nitrosopumilus sp.]